MSIKTKNPKKLEETIKSLIANRVKFSRECVKEYEKGFLKEWNVVNQHRGTFTEAFLIFLKRKENLLDTYETEIKPRRFKKDIETTHINVNPIIDTLLHLQDIGLHTKYDYTYIEDLDNKLWQKFKNAMLIVKKNIDEYIYDRQKKVLCKLTECFNGDALIKYCQFCGKKVEEDMIYCSDCGKEIDKM